MRNTFGLQSRNDNMPQIGVNHVTAVTELDDQSVLESSLGLYWTNEVKWGPKVRTVLGLRGDYFHWDVDDLALGESNSGSTESKLFEPKGSLILGPWDKTEFFLNGGYGFHSNAAGGLFANRSSDFILGPAGAVPNPNGLATPLARGRGAEVGMKTQTIPGLTTTAALWYLRLQSELIFDPVGDTGVPRGASERYGVEVSNTYRLHGWLTLDADWSASQAHFLEPDPCNRRHPRGPGHRRPGQRRPDRPLAGRLLRQLTLQIHRPARPAARRQHQLYARQRRLACPRAMRTSAWATAWSC